MKGLYSPIDRLAAELPRTKGTGAEFMTELSKRPGYKQQEAQDRDLQTLMALPKMDRAQFLESLKSKPNVMPKAKVLGKKYHEQYTIPGGTNYREILLQHPEGDFEGLPQHFGGAPNILASLRVKDRTDAEGKKILHIEELQSDWHQQGKKHGYLPKDYRAKLDAALERIKLAEGKHRLLKYELDKSKDWSNSLSKRLEEPDYPHHSSELAAKIRAESKQGLQFHNEKIMDLTPKVMKADEEMRQASAERRQLLQQGEQGIQGAPFKKNWPELALKKMIHYAADNGYDGIAVTPGAEQNKRYGLAKHVESINYEDEGEGSYFVDVRGKGQHSIINRRMTESELKSHLGKEIAQKIIDSEGVPNGMGREISGPNLEVGGEGMKGFYDKMIPSFLNQFGKKYGVKAEPRPIHIDGPTSKMEMLRASGIPQTQWGEIPYAQQEKMMAEYAAKQPPKTATVHHFPITPEMRKDVLTNGLPLYAKGGEVEVRPTVKDETIQRRIPEMEAAAKALQAGIIDRKEYDRVVKKHKPVKPYDFVPQPASDEDADRALMINKKPHWRGHAHWPAGRKVGLRLDIPAYEQHGVWVNSIHDEEGRDDDKFKTSYAPVSSVKNATFDASPEKAVKVATGEQNKSPFARIKGELHHMTEDEAVAHMKEHLNNPDYVQVGMDPRRHGYFYDRKNMKPITHSAHVVQIGPLVLAHKPTYGKRETYDKGGSVLSAAERKANLDKFMEGSVAPKVYHGTIVRPDPLSEKSMGDIHKFDRSYSTKFRQPSIDTVGSWFSDQPGKAGAEMYSGSHEGSVIYPVHLSIKNPHETTFELMQRRARLLANGKDDGRQVKKPEVDAYRKWLKSMGKDGVVIRHNPGAKNNSNEFEHQNAYIALEPHQIKSAIGNRGTYDIREDDITKATGGTVSHETIKPTGYTKEKVTVTPDMDVMQYELINRKAK